MKTARLFSPAFILAHVVALHLFALYFLTAEPRPTASGPAPEGEAVSISEVPVEAPAPKPEFVVPDTRPGALDLSRMYQDGDRIRADLGNGWTAELTTDAELQQKITWLLNRAKVPFGAAVVIDVKTGDVLALADRLDERHPVAPKLERGGPPHLALRAVAPAASVFKIVTAAALIEDAGVSPTRAYPYKKAVRRLHKAHLEKLDAGAQKGTLTEAIAKSNNGLIARLADQKLDRETLDAAARRFGFNQVVPFPLVTDPSTARVPRNALERARMAAGFWHTRLTPLHGALIAAAIARDGQMPVPRLVRRLEAPDGQIVEAPERPAFTTTMKPTTARKLRQMLAETSLTGTARRAMSKWPKGAPRTTMAGKTGSLAKRDPHTSYTWLVGYAPAEKPEIAFAVLAGNGELWWRRAPDIAVDLLAARQTLEKKRREGALARRK